MNITSANELCASETLTDIQNSNGTLTLNSFVQFITGLVDGTGNLPKDAACSDCSKESYNIFKQNFPALVSSDTTNNLSSECGSSFIGVFTTALLLFLIYVFFCRWFQPFRYHTDCQYRDHISFSSKKRRCAPLLRQHTCCWGSVGACGHLVGFCCSRMSSIHVCRDHSPQKHFCYMYRILHISFLHDFGQLQCITQPNRNSSLFLAKHVSLMLKSS